MPDDFPNDMPDVRDGLNRLERTILVKLDELQEEWGDRNVPTAQLYGRVVEVCNVSKAEFTDALRRLIGKG